jgi:hypothetical protein
LFLISCGLIQAPNSPSSEKTEASLSPTPTTLGSTQSENAEPEILAVDCTNPDEMVIAESIVEIYPVSNQQVTIWYCSGHSFEDILIALETGEALNISPGYC